ncbi:MAG TPA: hypothetical protein VN748_17350 [Pseudonocardiaceae bacterium]|nr:hypothetical protein [Pseudonocardiaceae bacterium]
MAVYLRAAAAKPLTGLILRAVGQDTAGPLGEAGGSHSQCSVDPGPMVFPRYSGYHLGELGWREVLEERIAKAVRDLGRRATHGHSQL